MRGALVIAFTLVALPVRAQPPPFLVVPPAPERREPDEVRVMRDDYAAALRTRTHLLRVVHGLDRHADARWMLTQSVFDPRSLVPTTNEIRTLVRSLLALDGGADAILARASEPSRVSQDDVVQRRVLLEIVRRLVEQRAVDTAFDVADQMVARFPCTHEAWRAYEATAALCGSSFGAADDLCARRPGSGWWAVPPPTWVTCDDPQWRDRAEIAWLNTVLRIHQRATQARQQSVVLEHDDVLARSARDGYEAAAAGYLRFFEEVVPPERSPDGYTLLYNLADAQFWAGHDEEAAASYARVRDWSWHDGRSALAGDFAAEAAWRVVEARRHLVDDALARGELVLPAPTSTPTTVPDVVAALILGREIYLARFADDPEHVRVSLQLGNAALLERYGYWDEAHARYAAVLDADAPTEHASEAAAGIVRMATALGDAAEVARVSALVPATP